MFQGVLYNGTGVIHLVGKAFIATYYNIFTGKGTAASREFFRIVA